MDLNQIISIIFTSLAASVTGAFIATIRTNIKTFKMLKSSQKVLIKDRIVSAHNEYSQSETIGKYALSVLEELYQEYLLLGGNGFVTALMSEIREFDIV